jgi:hypothetical protein
MPTDLIHKGIGFVLGTVKWPLALLSVLYLPAVADVFVTELGGLLLPPSLGGFMLLLGFICYLVTWFLIIRGTGLSWLSTLEHEITHSLFALLTFNRVTGIRTTLRNGGHMTYEGTPNWLIQTSPYFFPTMSFLLLIPLFLIPPILGEIFIFFIGVSVAYHALSTWHETHLGQTDFKEAGLLFVICFLPAANLFCYALFLNSISSYGFALFSTLDSIAQSEWAPTLLRLFSRL